jgi:dCTP deaminase
MRAVALMVRARESGAGNGEPMRSSTIAIILRAALERRIANFDLVSPFPVPLPGSPFPVPRSRFPTFPNAVMSIQSDRWITRMALEHRMIEPFEGRQVRSGVISYGVSSYGYDMRVAREFRIFTNVLNSIVDPKNFDPKSFVEFEGDVCIVPPNSFALARSVEYFRIPRDVLTVTVGKSTYARCGIITNVTPLEPEWEGYVTLEISNTTPLPAKIYANEGIAQVLFLKGDEAPEVSYRDKQGKYQGQTGVTLPKL